MELNNDNEMREPYFFSNNTTHGPIHIKGDYEFPDIATSEGWKGNGSNDNPYIIENLTIDAQGGKTGILIEWIYDSSFIISNCTIFNTTRARMNPTTEYFYGDIHIHVSRGTCKYIIDNNRCNWITAFGVMMESNEHYNYITNNTGLFNGSCKIQVKYIDNLIFRDNDLSGGGALIENGYWVIVEDNIFSSVSKGLKIDDTRGIIRKNLFRNNSIAGLHLHDNHEIHISKNTFINSTIIITGEESGGNYKGSFTDLNLGESNTINGKKIYHYTDLNNSFTVPSDAGYVLLCWSSNVTLKNMDLTGVGEGLFMISVSRIEIINCTFSNNSRHGVEIIDSNYVRVTNCFLTGNDLNGIKITNSYHVSITDSTFFENRIGILADYVTYLKIYGCTFKNSSSSAVYIMGYSIIIELYLNMFINNNINNTTQCTDVSGQLTAWNHKNGYGNYWSDWREPDNNLDGIVDVPYGIAGGTRKDNFPLVSSPNTELLPPDGLVARGFDSNIRINWSDPYNDKRPVVSSINIYRRAEVEKNFTLIKKVSPEMREYNDTSATNGVNYTYYLTQEDYRSETEPSRTVTARSEGPPEPPGNIEISCIKDHIIINWSTPSNNGGYSIEGYSVYKNISDTNFERIANLTVQTINHIDTEIEAGYLYSYYVTCWSLLGESIPSEVVSIKPVDVPEPPISDQMISGNEHVKISWLPPVSNRGEPIQGYRIYRRNVTTNSPYKMIQKMLPHGSFYNDTAVLNGMVYSYKVTCFNKVGESTYSKEMTGTPSEPTIEFGIPTRLFGTYGNEYVMLEWTSPVHDPSHHLRGYNIYKSFSGSEPSLVDFSSIKNYKDYFVKKSFKYTYYVSAVYFSGESDLSQNFSISIPEEGNIEPLSSPKKIQVTQTTNGVIVKWSIPNDDRSGSILHYKVFRGTSQEDLKLLEITTKTKITDMQVENGITYYYTVSAVYLIGESPNGEVLSIEYNLGMQQNGFPSVKNASYSIDKKGVLLEWNLWEGYKNREPVVIGIRRISDHDSGNGTYRIDANSTEYMDTDVEPGEYYNYVITIEYLNGSSDEVCIYFVYFPGDNEEEIIENDPYFDLFKIMTVFIIIVVIIALFLMVRMSRNERD